MMRQVVETIKRAPLDGTAAANWADQQIDSGEREEQVAP
jgi:hypothetical protein